jgi:energy-coupling factor transport system substrate-specific component
MGAGFAGVETAFALIILAGYVFGSRFGLWLGALSILTSSLIAGGVGPWLPFQIFAAALVGFGAGAIPKPRSIKIKLFALSMYAVLSSYVYGALLTFWTWPLFVGANTSISFLDGASFQENLWRFIQFEFYSGGLLWDTGRAITSITLILLTGKALMTTLDRVATRADYSKA